MIVTLLSLALWFLCGAEAFAILVRRKANLDQIRCMDGEWDVYWSDSWMPFSVVLIFCMVFGLGGLAFQLANVNPTRLYNFGFSIVARTVVPWDIAQKLEGEEKKQQPQASQAAPSSQQLPLPSLLQQQQGQFGQPPLQPQQLGLPFKPAP